MKEFDLIKRYFKALSAKRHDVLLGIGDDCALLQPPSEQVIAVTTDTLVAGIHFFPSVKPFDLGYKALAVNLSDLAAMGAEPAWVSLALSSPNINEQWLAQFCEGFSELAKQYHLQLVGGDTTQGPLSITITVHGFVPADKALRRAAARVGDKIYVTGTLGDAGAGLKILQNELQTKEIYSSQLISRLHKPTPRVLIGMALRGIANAAIDISDGLAGDLNHILTQSKLGARLNVDYLPISATLAQAATKDMAWQLALTAGDDYELCFTVPPANEIKLKQANIACTYIGEIEQESGLRLYLASGDLYQLPVDSSYQHFC
jgi:thiamine-monophosphate kinase